MRRRFLVPVLAAVVFVAVLATANAQAAPRFTSDRNWAPAGGVITVSGTECRDAQGPGGSVAVQLMTRFFGSPVGLNQRFPVAADGTWGGDFTVPAGTASGEYE